MAAERENLIDFAHTGDFVGENSGDAVPLKAGISGRPGEVAMLEPDIDTDAYSKAENEIQETHYSKLYQDIDKINLNQAELDLNGDWSSLKEKMVDLTDNNGFVLKLDKSKGVDSRPVPKDACVTINYEIRIEGQDEPFDSSFIRGVPERHRLGSSMLLHGLEILILSMNVGDTAIGIIAPSHAFGRQGVPPRIPENSELLVVVQLLNFTEDGQAEKLLRQPISERQEMELDDLVDIVHKENRTGNQFFQEEEWSLAVQHYDLGLTLLEERYRKNKFSSILDKNKEVTELLVKLYLNKSLCYLKLEKSINAVKAGRKALGYEPENPKANYRLGKAFVQLKDFEQARECFMAAARRKPNDSQIRQELLRLEEMMLREKEMEEEYCVNMFKKYEKPKKVDQAVLDSPHYKLLTQFKAEADCPELNLPATFFVKDIDLLRKGCQYLNLNLRLITSQGHTGDQKIVITRKSN